MNHDFTLDREPPPVPVATREILGGGGLKLHAREWGNPGGPALLLIHGWSQSDLCWLNQVRGDLASTFRIVTFDLRGHGLSDKPTQPEHYATGNCGPMTWLRLSTRRVSSSPRSSPGHTAGTSSRTTSAPTETPGSAASTWSVRQ